MGTLLCVPSQISYTSKQPKTLQVPSTTIVLRSTNSFLLATFSYLRMMCANLSPGMTSSKAEFLWRPSSVFSAFDIISLFGNCCLVWLRGLLFEIFKLGIEKMNFFFGLSFYSFGQTKYRILIGPESDRPSDLGFPPRLLIGYCTFGALW